MFTRDKWSKMDFLNRLLNRPQQKPAICHSPPPTQESVGVVDQTEASSSGPSSLAPESLSSASSFQSLSSKSSSGICADSAPGSPDKTVLVNNSNIEGFDQSYVNVEIPDLDDLISACANINLGGPRSEYRNGRESPDSDADLSQNQTFTSAADDTIGDVTQVFVQEAVQTFKTCPDFEKQAPLTTTVFKSPLPVVQSPKAAARESTSSVIPYVSFEQSVLRKNQGEEQPVVPTLKVDSPRRRSYTPTPCEEIDVAQIATRKSDSSFISAEDGTGEKPQSVNGLGTPNGQTLETEDVFNTPDEQKLEIADNFGTPDVSFQEVQNFNSTVLLNSDDNKSIAKTPEKCNLTTYVSAPETHLQKQNNTTTPNKVVNTENVEAAQEENVLTVQNIVLENKVLNKTQEIVKGNNLLNKTQEIVKEDNPLNKTQEVLENNLLNKTQEFVKKENPTKTQAIVKEENILNETQEIVKEDKFLNTTQEIVKEENILNKTQEIGKESNSLNKEQEIGKTENILNKPQGIVKEDNIFNKAQEIVKEQSFLNETQDIVSETNTLNHIQNSTTDKVVSNVSQNAQITQSTIEANPVDTNKFEDFKEPVITVKTPSKLYGKKESKSPSHIESFYYDESQNPNEVAASTPLNWKREEKQKTPKRQSALFNQEVKSPPQFPSPSSLNKIFNSPSKDKATKEQENKVNFDQTIAVNKSLERSSFTASELISKNSSLDLLPSQEPDYEAFKPQQQSTTLPFSAQCPNFEVLQEAALSVAKEIDESLEKIEEEQFVSATTDLFGDPSALDFLTQVGSQTSNRGERYDSLYMKFDPLAQRQSMLPQKNLPVTPAFEEEEEQKETKVDTSIGNTNTPRKNPALAAIDRLLFYSPSPPATTDSEKVEAKQRKEEAEKKEPQSVPVVNEEMAKELELVRSTVLQLEAELEKQKQEHEKQLEKQRGAYDDKVMQIQAKFGQMQSQLSQETKCKDQMTVVVEEYEKSISRLIAEREKEKLVFTQERDRIKSELDISQQHLANSEAAFTDVHSKYERLKSVVGAYKSNEEVLKESIAENQETIKTLENRYDQLKSHAMAQLEKANLELSAIKKQHEADVLKLKAMVRKTELRCKTLEETVEQKSKENKELTQIIDEMIARVD